MRAHAAGRSRRHPGAFTLNHPPEPHRASGEDVAPADELPDPASGRGRALAWLAAFALVTTLALIAVVEVRTSYIQSEVLPDYAGSLSWRVEPGPSPSIRFPTEGPSDIRLGYALLPQFSRRLTDRGYVVANQARFSDALGTYVDHGFFPPYREKMQSGATLSDCRGELMFAARHPQRQYASFDAIPPLVRDTLLFIENRRLLDPQRPRLNPALEWTRLGRAVVAQAARIVDDEASAPGGSTLATQIEKYRHSADGVTYSAGEKLRQMVSATVRTYREGRETLPARQHLVLEYLNTVPLSAAAGFGEVLGLGDGLWAWFGADFEQTNALLVQAGDEASLSRRALALRQVLALMIAHRRPSYYLARGREDLEVLADAHLRLLASAGQIDAALRDAALAVRLPFRAGGEDPQSLRAPLSKGASSMRSRLAGLLDVSQYDLDRLDLQAATTLDRRLQASVETFLGRLGDVDFARQSELIGERLIDPARIGEVRYAFTLFERGEGENRVRVQTDTSGAAFDINEQAKLELGSTAKLRVLATYLEIVAELHERIASGEARTDADDTARDPISRWAEARLAAQPDLTLEALLAEALQRRFSASPAESFFTGGGVHTFSNFRHEDDGRTPTVLEALQASLNLPFVRLMREIVRYETMRIPGSTARLLADSEDPRRALYLAKFADREGRTFLQRFWRKYRDRRPEEQQATILDGLGRNADRLASAWRYLNPDADLAAFAAFMGNRLGESRPGDEALRRLFQRFDPGAWSLADQGYLARVHPLELWLVGYLSRQPGATLEEAFEASAEERQAVYGWLLKTHAKNAQDQRILSMLEVEAFLEIHRRWARLGYPFPQLVPSLATALGSSGDRPAALAELMGIIVNDGRRAPTRRLSELLFAEGTPYESRFLAQATESSQVMRPEVARALRAALAQVVEAGTARRLAGAIRLEDGTTLSAGGKTGTGDNRIVVSGDKSRGGVALNRTATFVFYLGNDHFGTLTAYVMGRNAAEHRFTSALPVQILRQMAPLLAPHLGPAAARRCEISAP
ncbi:MAG: transglycosylase domain-containing protein [Rhodocyclaceae bacterium]|nr:transglycosylase domain-containing protein [Rhodocyclaceae bacterium]